MEYLLQLDGNILLYIQEFIRQDFMTPFWKFITSLGDGGWFWIALSVILMIPKKTRPIGFAALLAVGIGALITNVALKNIIARTRPYEVVDGLRLIIDRQSDFSFPSGHSCASFAAAMVYYKSAPKKWGISAVVLASLIAFSRLYVGVHYPSDVLAGIAVGIFAAWSALQIIELYNRKKSDKCQKEA